MTFDIARALTVLKTHEALSGIFGSISLASWIFVSVPQLIENFRLQSGEGISLAFLFVWFVGDIANFVGAVWAGLVPTVITLAVYFCVADLILIIQCLYYKFLNARKSSLKQSAVPSEVTSESPNQPLLIRRGSDIGLPGSRRPSSASQSRRGSNLMSSSLPAISEEDEFRRSWLRHGVSILLVCVAGAAGWFVAWSTGVWTPTAEDGNDGTVRAVVGAEILGYLTMLTKSSLQRARIPQIVKNHKEQSCEGLSLLFFMLSLLGNATYGSSVNKF
ncbi:hypothetical protein MMC12_002061 [Toensbergia leucococca]|nr:hypothetical protein [Toensbergia leucococca]